MGYCETYASYATSILFRDTDRRPHYYNQAVEEDRKNKHNTGCLSLLWTTIDHAKAWHPFLFFSHYAQVIL
jgi:hypothetical protein